MTVNLTPREREVLGLIADGLSASQIARMLNIAPGTVMFYRKTIRKRLGLETDQSLADVAKAMRKAEVTQ